MQVTTIAPDMAKVLAVVALRKASLSSVYSLETGPTENTASISFYIVACLSFTEPLSSNDLSF
jgi:hypothetical protein